MKFVGPSYTLNARKADTQRTVNMHVVAHEVAGGKAVAYLDSTPGLTEFSARPAPEGLGYLLLEDGGFLLLESGGKIILE
jgi:hypothetical protein